jgi:hypothetical protein
MFQVFKMTTAATEQLVCSAVSEERVCYGCAMCIPLPVLMIWHVQPLVISPLAGTYDIHIRLQVGTRNAYFIYHVNAYITFLI